MPHIGDSSARRTVLLVVAVLCTAGVLAIGLLTVPGEPWSAPDLLRSRQWFEVGRDHAFLAVVARWVGYLTVPTVLRAVTLIAAVVLWRRGRRGAAVWWAVTMVVGGAVAIATRYAVARPRPHWPGSGPPVEGYTFPSGHAMNAAVFALCVLIVGWPVLARGSRLLAVLAGAAFTLLVGASRVLLGVHHVSDVLAAWLLAVTVVTVLLTVAVSPAVRRRATARWPLLADRPSASPAAGEVGATSRS